MKTKRIFLLVAVVFALALALTACSHEHTWVKANCETPKTCSECGATEGVALGHTEKILAGKYATCAE